MTDLRQAAQQGLEALRGYRREIDCHQPCDAERGLEAALEQPEQEPVAWLRKLHYLLGHAENMPPADRALALEWEPLYTHPPRREWQSLTEEEMDCWTPEIHPAIRAIEAKLKEKNA